MRLLTSISGVFWSPTFYAREVQPGGSGKIGFGLLALACLFAVIIQSVVNAPFYQQLHTSLNRAAELLPVVEVKDGKLYAHLEDQPFTFEETVKGETFRMVIDTTRAEYDDAEIAALAREHIFLAALTSEYLYFYDPQKKSVEREELSGMLTTDHVFTPQDYKAVLNKLLLIGSITALFVLFLAKWLGNIVLALLLGLIGQAAKPRQFSTSQYADLLRVASYSLVPLILIASAVPFQLGAVAYTCIAILHYILMLQIAKRGIPGATAAAV